MKRTTLTAIAMLGLLACGDAPTAVITGPDTGTTPDTATENDTNVPLDTTSPDTGDTSASDTADTSEDATICVPVCSGRECGDDSCGGSCGSCPEGEFCSSGECQEGEPPICTWDVSLWDDGCVLAP